MAGYLEGYGVDEVRREKLIKRISIGVAAALVVGVSFFLLFHNFSERQVAKSFLDLIKARNYPKAYELWGCTASSPCRDYRFEKFMEDWGPGGVYARVTQGRYSIEDACGPGVVFTLEMPGQEPVGIYVNRSDRTVGFAPWPRCPGRHWHLWEFIRSHFRAG